MSEREDTKVSERYRALAREEPGAALDAAILAAARRAVGARPGAARARLRRWALPGSVAAVVVLSVTVTLQIQRERPDAVALYAPEPKKIEQGAAREAQAPGARDFAPDPAAGSERSVAGRVTAPASAPAGVPAERAPAPAAAADTELARPRAEEAPAGAGAVNEAMRRSAPAELRAKTGETDESPERWLERIVALRRAGRDREADESFAEFRKRYPEYRISQEMLGKLTGKR